MFSSYWLLLLLVPVLLIPFLREIGVLHDVDERLLQNSYRTSHVAFLSMILLVIVIIVDRCITGIEPPDDALVLLLIFPLIVKLGSSLLLNRSMLQAGMIIGCLFGAIWIIYALVSYGFSLEGLMQSLIGLGILATTGIALLSPLIGGVLLLIEACVTAVLILRIEELMTKIFLFTTLSFPLLFAGLCFLTSIWKRHASDEDDEE